MCPPKYVWLAIIWSCINPYCDVTTGPLPSEGPDIHHSMTTSRHSPFHDNKQTLILTLTIPWQQADTHSDTHHSMTTSRHSFWHSPFHDNKQTLTIPWQQADTHHSMTTSRHSLFHDNKQTLTIPWQQADTCFHCRHSRRYRVSWRCCGTVMPSSGVWPHVLPLAHHAAPDADTCKLMTATTCPLTSASMADIYLLMAG